MTSSEQVARLPIEQVNNVVNLMVRDVADVKESTMPGEFDRIASQRYLSVTANVEGESMGFASRQVSQAIAAAGTLPRGVRVQMRGQLKPMDDMFKALAVGLSIAVVVILVLLTAYFESPRLALISVSAVPCVLAGVVMILFFTGGTLNLESFMGTIMCIGVSVSNSVMLVTFAGDHWRAGKPAIEAATSAAAERLRPIMMTACAMIVGMVPMSLALEAGSQMQAPLGRAVIGGLTMSTFTTLLIVPAVFAFVVGEAKRHSLSVHPDDAESPYFDPPEDPKSLEVLT
jgi:multidrug efflux pump subunit AcrB